jgi:hypothetical protein
MDEHHGGSVPTFLVRTRDGKEHTMHASRLRTDALHAYLEVRSGQSWRPVAEFRLEAVRHVQRRLDEPDGSCTWITELTR